MAYSEQVLDHLHNPRNVGRFPDGTPGVAAATVGSAAEGDLIKLALRRDGERIVEARFKAFGCTTAIAASSYATELVTGRTVAEAAAITADQIAGGLAIPDDKRRLAVLAVTAIRAALEGWD